MPDVGIAPVIYPARPRIRVDDQDQPELGQRLRGLFVEETIAGLYRCEATFSNWGPKDGGVGFLYFDREILGFGKILKIEMGAGQAAGQIFEGRVMGIEGRFLRERPPEILVLVEDRLQDLRMRRRTRTYEDITDADLFKKVASEHGLQANVEVNGLTHRLLAQLNQSDLAFLRERARAVDAELWVEASTLNVKSRNRRMTGDVTLTYQKGLHEFSVLADLAGQATGFTVSGWDVASKQPISYRASEASLHGELNGDQSGSALLTQKIGQRDQQVVHDLPFSVQEAQIQAEAYYRRNARRFVVGNGLAEGDARLRVGTKLELKGVGNMFDGIYYVVRVRHTLDMRHGYRTQFGAERPGIGG